MSLRVTMGRQRLRPPGGSRKARAFWPRTSVGLVALPMQSVGA